MATEVYSTGTPAELFPAIEAGHVQVIDVRSDEEWNEGHVAQAEHRFLGRLPQYLDDLPRTKN